MIPIDTYIKRNRTMWFNPHNQQLPAKVQGEIGSSYSKDISKSVFEYFVLDEEDLERELLNACDIMGV